MATVNIPSSATTTFPTGGMTLTPTSVALATQDNYVSALTTAALALHKRDVSEDLIKRYGDQGITGLLELVGAKKETTQTNFEHYEEAFIHNSLTVQVEDGDGAIAVGGDTLNFISADNTDQLNGDKEIVASNQDMPFRVGDILLLEKGDLVYVQAVSTGNSDGNSDIEVFPLGAALSGYTGEFKCSIVGNMFPEATGQPNSLLPRVHTYKNSVMILKESFEVSGSEATNVVYFKVENEHMGSGYLWYLKGEQDTYRRFMDYAEIMMLIGTKVTNTNLTGATATIDGVASTSLSTLNGSEGLLPFIENNGQSMDLGSSSITMADFDAIVKSLDKYRGSQENALYAGINLSLDVDDLLATQNAVSSGGANYGTFNNSKDVAVNLGFNSFTRGGYTFHKKTYDLFNHPKLLGMDNSNYPGFGIVIPMDSRRDARTGDKIPSLRIRYKAVPGYSREMEHWLTGSAVLKNKTNTSDVLKSHYRTERGFEGFAPNIFMLIKKS
jgi:hypothetical protein